MRIRSIVFLIFQVPFIISFGQEKWSLERCVQYAMEHNISVRQTDLQAQFSALDLKQSKASQLPSFNLQTSAGYSFGLSENPTTGILQNNNFFNSGSQLQAQVTLFNWFNKKNINEANRLTYDADQQQTEKVKNDIALNVAAAYLQVLLAREQTNVSKIQLAQTRSQLENTLKQVEAGNLPELNAAQLEAQLATDSAALITNETSAQQFILQLKALLNLDAGVPFDVETPPVDKIPIESLAELQPEQVYNSALINLPQQKVNELRIQSAIKTASAMKAAMYPSFGAFGGLNTRYVNNKKIPVYDQVITGYAPTAFRTNAGGGVYYGVEQPVYQPGPTVTKYLTSDPFSTQLRENFGQNIGIGLDIPLFNGRRARTDWERSKLTIKNLELTKAQGDQQLKQDIYKAYTDATAAIQKFNANQKAVQTAQKAYDFATKRYELGMLSTYELLSTQTTLLTAKTQLLYAQYDYVFKMKLLEFYKGQGLKL